MSDKLDLKKHIRDVEDFPIPGIKFRDITSLIETPEPFRKLRRVNKDDRKLNADLIVSIESEDLSLLVPFQPTFCFHLF